MSIKIGDINLAQEIIELHYQLARTQLVIDELLKKSLVNISPEDIKVIDRKALSIVQQKFPSMGVTEKEQS